MKLDDIFCLDLHGYMTQLYTVPEMPEGQRFDYLFHNEFAGAVFPIVFRQKKGYGGNKLVDFLNLGLTTFGPVSDRVVGLLRDGGFTGWDTYPVEVLLKDGSRLPGYQGLMVTGGECDTDISLSEQVDTIGPWPYGQADVCLKELPIVLDSWDGSDMFRLKSHGGVYISRRLRDALKEAKISNLDLGQSAADFFLSCDSDGMFRLGEQSRPMTSHFPPDSPLRAFFHLDSGYDPSFGPRVRKDPNTGRHFFRLLKEQSVSPYTCHSPVYVDDGSCFPTLVHRSVISVLESGRFSGWDADPAQILFNDGRLSRDFFELHVSGRCRIDPAVSVPVPVEWVFPKRKKRSTGFKGFPLDTASWDGSDIFRAGDSPYVFISARLRDALRQLLGADHFVRNAADCLITDFPPFGDIFPMLSDFHGNTTA